MQEKLVLWAAQGFGVGKLPKAPGTFGTLAGFAWVACLMATGRTWAYVAGTLLGCLFAVYVCGRAEKLLNETDPPSVVIDEIAAFPLCFVGPVLAARSIGRWPGVQFWASTHGIIFAILGFALFRLFDIWKPGPIRTSQKLPGGWGVVIDDVLAAGLAGLILSIGERLSQ